MDAEDGEFFLELLVLVVGFVFLIVMLSIAASEGTHTHHKPNRVEQQQRIDTYHLQLACIQNRGTWQVASNTCKFN